MHLNIGELLRGMDFGEDMNETIRGAFPGSGMPSFDLKRGQHKYAIVGEHGKKQYCYTPHRAEDGYFYTFEYVCYWRDPRLKTKKGRDSMPPGTLYQRWKIAHLTKARTRKLAMQRAYDRYDAARGVSRKAKEIATRIIVGPPNVEAMADGGL